MKNKNHKGNGMLQTIISCILGFFLSLFLVSLFVLLITKVILFSQNSFYKNIISFDYSSFVTNEFYSNAESITLPTGFPPEILEGVINNSRVYEDIYGYIEAAFHKTSYTPDTNEWENKLRENIMTFLASENYTVTEADQKSIDDYITSIREEYSNRTKIPLLNQYVALKTIYDKFFLPALGGIIIVIGTILFSIFRMNHWFHRGLRYIAHSLLGTSFLLAVLPAYILISGFYRRINLAPEYFYNFIMSLLTHYLQAFLYASIIISILWIAVVIGCEKARKNAY